MEALKRSCELCERVEYGTLVIARWRTRSARRNMLLIRPWAGTKEFRLMGQVRNLHFRRSRMRQSRSAALIL